MFQCQFVITEQCNLACKYCYMKNKKTKMTEDVFFNSLNFINNSELKSKMIIDKEEKNLLAFFGGEPLMNFDLLKTIQPKIPNNIPKAMPTNGLLLDKEKYDFLLNSGFSVSLSFDGKYGNDKNRILFSNKESSLNKYTDFHFNIMKKRGCKVMLHPNIFPHLVDTYLYFNSLEIFHTDFTLVRDNIYSDLDINIFKDQLHELTNIVIEQVNTKNLMAIPGILSLYILDTIIFNHMNQKRPFGCFAGTHGVGILPNGKIYPCARFASNDKLILADSISGIIYKDNIEFISKIYNPQNFSKCQKCKLYNVCNAGCSFSQLENGKWNSMEPIDSVCELLKISYRESYRLFNACKDNKVFLDFLTHLLNNN